MAHIDENFVSANGIKSQPPLFVERRLLDDLGFTIQSELGSGHCSAVYQALYQNRPIALKIGRQLQKEVDHLKIAHEMQIGPALIMHTVLRAQTDCFPSFSSSSSSSSSTSPSRGAVERSAPIDVIAMEKLDYTLQQLIEQDRLGTHSITALYDLARRCFDNNFCHRDLHTGNIMRETRNGSSFRLIDFSPSTFGQDRQSKKAIFEEWRALFYHVKGKTPSHNVDVHMALAAAIRRIETEWLSFYQARSYNRRRR